MERGELRESDAGRVADDGGESVRGKGRYSWVTRPPVFPWKVSPSEVERALFGERFHRNFLSKGSFALPSRIKGVGDYQR